MAITIAQIKELREATAAGMGACKEALTATNGDMTFSTSWVGMPNSRISSGSSAVAAMMLSLSSASSTKLPEGM